jgi:thioesterase domain-containing protein/acyl carrier protein
MSAVLGFTEQHRLLAVASISFDIAGLDLYLPLSQAAQVIINPSNNSSDPDVLSLTLSGQEINIMQATPVTWKSLTETQWKGAPDLTILCGGEAMPANLPSSLKDRCKSLWNLYGPTETTVWATSSRISRLDSASASLTRAIGRPIANTKIYLLNEYGEPVPIGVGGEIYIGGAGVARGYLNRPGLTAERFVPDPYSSVPGSRIYRTGDLGRYLGDGNLEFLGRNDHQVKIRGFRIELGEIEAGLREHAGIREAVVLAGEDAAGEKRLVAYVVGVGEEEEEGNLARSLRRHLAARLPEYMVPAAYVRLRQLPLTPNRKLDRKALPAPGADAYAARRYEAPVGEIERQLAAIWAEVLKIERVGRHDNFFELGGHSLLAMQLMARVRRTFGISLLLRDLFICPTLCEFSIVMQGGHSKTDHRNLVPIRPKGNKAPLFFIHPAGGGVGYVRQIAPFINKSIPIYGLEATGLVPGQKPLETVEQMAQLYIHRIRQVQPHGPYRLAGWSAGGIISYEMVKQFISLDERVDFLGLLDTSCPQFMKARPPDDFNDKRELIRMLSWYLDDAALDHVRQMAETFDIMRLVQKIYEMGLLQKEDALTVSCYLATQRAIRRAVGNYSMAKLATPTWFFEAKEKEEGNDKPTLQGWHDAIEGSIQVISVDGTHLTMMESPKNLKFLGSAISDAVGESEHNDFLQLSSIAKKMPSCA